MDKMDYFIELYGHLPRGGPGDSASTARAFAMMEGLPQRPTILDIGCGPGKQTLEIARLSGGEVLALDLLPVMLERLERAAAEAGLAGRISTVQIDMNEMDFPEETFDVIWAEGSIYILGFKNGLRKCRPFLKAGGFFAVTEAVWLKPDPPGEAKDFWKEYPEIDFVEQKLGIIEATGFKPTGHFILPASSWWADYYEPLATRIERMEEEWQNIPAGMAVIDEARREIEAFRNHSDYYSYAFFIMQK